MPFFKFVGPMLTLMQGARRYEKGKIYRTQDRALYNDLRGNERFREVPDPKTGEFEELAERALDPQGRSAAVTRGLDKSRASITGSNISASTTEERRASGLATGPVPEEDAKAGKLTAGAEHVTENDEDEDGPVIKTGAEMTSDQEQDAERGETRTEGTKGQGGAEETPTKSANKPKGGVQIGGKAASKDATAKSAKAEEAEKVEEVPSEEDSRPKLPANGFTSKKEAGKWAKENLDLDLDTSKALTTLNRQVEDAYLEKYRDTSVEGEDEGDDDVVELNTPEAR